MTWSAPKTWTGSEVLTAADMNTYVGSNTEYLYDNMPIANNWIGQGTSIAQENQRIESGSVWTMQTTETNGTIAVTFNQAFGSAPRVVCSAMQPNRASVGSNVGTGGFTLVNYVSAGGTYTGTIWSNWIAIGA